CKKFRRIIITCRTQFFRKDEEIPLDTGILRIGPRKAGVKGSYEFRKLYLSPFNDKDIKRYLIKRYPFWRYPIRRKALAMALKIPLLSARPMLLAHIPDVVEAGGEITYVFQLYDIMIEAWLERESAWVEKAPLREFSERIAIDLYVNREARGMERVSYDDLPELAENWDIPLEQWQLSGRSLLNRDAEGNFKFAHRSIMEYLFVQRFL
ncbi:MAG: hypothetical protein GY859_11220, partial [Desulfobacterales bacterium]|nr:hypothetical protein [Desulfobacterales bacterium]